MEDMNYETFKLNVQRDIKDFLPEKYENSRVEIREVSKNNEKLDAITILNDESNMTPSIYLNDFYKEIEKGASYDDVVQKIADVRVQYEHPDNLDVTQITDFEQAKGRLMPRIYGMEHNSELLEQRPFTQMDDLAITYCVNLKEDGEGIMSAPVTHNLMETWGVTIEDINAAAIANLNENTEIKFRGMGEVLKEMMTAKMMQEEGVDFDEARDMINEMIPPDDRSMYVLSTDSQLNGAVALLNDKVMDDITEKIGDFYILPSSVHEVILVPKETGMDLEVLENMVREVNATQVAPQDQLSDHVYTYDNETHEVYRADHEEEHNLAKQAAQETRNEETKSEPVKADEKAQQESLAKDAKTKPDRSEKTSRTSLKDRLEEKKTEVKQHEKKQKEQVKSKDQSL